MLEKLKYIAGYAPTRPIFVIGTGRSGTHWLGYSLGDHPEIRATIETYPMFKLSTQMAMDVSKEARDFDRLVRAYRWQLLQSAPKLYMDKTHPNIWIAEKLKKAFPDAQFVGIERNPYATVASMMVHKQVSAWHKNWRKFPIPNRFLGITEQDAERYPSLSLAAQCAMRWVAHRDKLLELRTKLGKDLMTIQYEVFAHNPVETITELQQFLGLETPIPVPEVKSESLDKWKLTLTEQDIADIHQVTGVLPPEKS